MRSNGKLQEIKQVIDVSLAPMTIQNTELNSKLQMIEAAHELFYLLTIKLRRQFVD